MIPEVFLNNPWIDFNDVVSDTLLITFSSAATPIGKFTPYLAVAGLPYSVLRVNCPDPFWYVGGIPQTDMVPNGFENALNDFIVNNNFKKVVVFGGSKGGFGALDIGLRIKSDVIISTGAETVFGHPDGYAVWHVPPPRIDRARRRIIMWPALVSATERKIHVFYGATSPIDRVFALEAKLLLGCEPIVLRGCGHSVPQFVADNYSFSKFIFEFAECGKSDFVNKFSMRSFFPRGSFEELILECR